jgi:hypothetical protein
MSSIKYHCHIGDSFRQDLCLEEWPKFPCEFEKYSNEFNVGLMIDSVRTVVQIQTTESRDLHVVRISNLIHRVLSDIFHETPHVHRRIILKPGSFDGKATKALSLLALKKFVPQPIYLLIIDSTSNFYIGYTISNLLNVFHKLMKNKCDFECYINEARKTMRIRETFETQYMMEKSLRTHHEFSVNQNTNQGSRNETQIGEFILAPYSDVEMVNAQTRRKNYLEYLENERGKQYPETYDGTLDYVKGVFLKIKLFVQDYEHMKKNLEAAKKALVSDRSNLVNPETLPLLEKAISDLEDKSSEFKCILCVTSWRNCFLPGCKHTHVCRDCVIRSRSEFNRYECSICRTISSFIVTDIDEIKINH